jgi:hypothetical protein
MMSSPPQMIVIEQLKNKHIERTDDMINNTTQHSVYAINQYLRGELFCAVHYFVMSDLKLSEGEVGILKQFLEKFLEQILVIYRKNREALTEVTDLPLR